MIIRFTDAPKSLLNLPLVIIIDCEIIITFGDLLVVILADEMLETLIYNRIRLLFVSLQVVHSRSEKGIGILGVVIVQFRVIYGLE
jgi:hypothetical protein